MTPLLDIVARRIRAEGPMSLAEYMALCLSHPTHGYYTTRDPLGAAGDFTTAPEVSQMFGELLGLWLATVWRAAGRPDPFALVELGPGRGTLMADAWRATAAVPGFHAAARLSLVETSPALRARQAETLGHAAPQWADRLEAVPDLPLFGLANEFFDALPIRQFWRRHGAWQERMVGLAQSSDHGAHEVSASAPEGRAEDATVALAYGLSPPVEADLPPGADGEVLEIAPLGAALAAQLGGRIARRGGAFLALDYGAWDGRGDSFQALSGHAPVDPLAAPGQADLTAHVRFRPLAEAAGLPVVGFATQAAFLAALGIGQRAAALARGGNAERIAAELRRLTDAAEMGELFKAMALLPKGAQPPPGFRL